jgi:putative tricarboxylic transport membrane protein
MFGAGLLGLVCRRARIPIGPLVLGLILGPMMEANLRRALILSRGDWGAVLSKPIALFFLVATALSLAWPLLRTLWRKDSGTTP